MDNESNIGNEEVNSLKNNLSSLYTLLTMKFVS